MTTAAVAATTAAAVATTAAMRATATAAMRASAAAMRASAAHMRRAKAGMCHRTTATTEMRPAGHMRGAAHPPAGQPGMTDMRRAATARREACPAAMPGMPRNTAMRRASMPYSGVLHPGMHRARMLAGVTCEAVCGNPAGNRCGRGARR